MKLLRSILDKQAKWFEKGGKLQRLYPLWEANDTFLYTPGTVTRAASHVRDALELKRLMITVVVALGPCVLWAMFNTGYQANAALNHEMMGQLSGWRHFILQLLGSWVYNPHNPIGCIVHGALYFFPVYIVTLAAGGAWEVLFAIVRRHEINEGFLVTSLLFPLILPATIPLWQVALGISFGVVIAKEVFGGVGMNILNPALAARAFLFFAYPGQISGDQVWTAVPEGCAVDGFSGATWLARAAEGSLDVSWLKAFVGLIPGSMGETSTLFCIFGAVVLVMSQIGSWRVMAGVFVGTLGMSLLLNGVGSETNPMFAMPFWWHMVLGGWAFGTVFMATDPVTACYTNKGRLIYGFLIGVLVVLVRVVNPAYPEGMMLAILLMNVFSPLIDYFFVRANIRRRLARNAA
ncbi:MAG TPA: NADH:ubiquinone reductase (Na(+)-transporting) subunit B [Candidatus Hydrogenedentes bacterium]|nr:NADH:ubiquinone reductase (Na(+)-transporting) subunit B [Candidatus Hydrogenedentota bacterium]HOZ49316.1 NADH:ubiquinone reductase (Na(+)-transporting) subunit B [Candidatus Hydrogenedentota bacterium]HPG69669.1 NADH:ubiquinone reductase (Na(+)-transporting) subunit B [Candidatus Hydrogenedentota bacterium]